MARNKVSEREYLNSAGDTVDSVEKATGARYSLGSGKGDDFKATKSWDYQFGAPGAVATMFAIMGWHTKLGNVANTVLNDKENPGTLAQAAAEIDEFVSGAEQGKWAERTGGGGGLRYDPEKMAQAIAQVTGKDAAVYQAKMGWRVDSKGVQVAQNADGSWPKGAITYPAFAARNATVRAAYDALAGTGVSVDAL
jgi:hypothetical protein